MMSSFMNSQNYLTNLEEELQAWDKGHQTKITYPYVVRQYLAVTKEEEIFTRQAINRYMLRLDKKGKSQNTKRLHYYVLKRFFEVNNQPWPFPKGGPKRGKEAELKAPKMSTEDVKKLLQRSKVSLDDWEVGIVALATTYGVRREEILQLRSGDIHEGKLFIRTVKGGVETEHLLPEVVAPYISCWAELPDRYRPGGLSSLSRLYHSILSRCEIEDAERGGYHSIRRRLATDLRETGLDLGIIYQFLRWNLPSVLGILGTDGRIEQSKVDNMVFRVHPYLDCW